MPVPTEHIVSWWCHFSAVWTWSMEPLSIVTRSSNVQMLRSWEQRIWPPCEGQIKAGWGRTEVVTLWVTTLNFDKPLGLVSVFTLSATPLTSDPSPCDLINEPFLKPRLFYERDQPWPGDNPDIAQHTHTQQLRELLRRHQEVTPLLVSFAVIERVKNTTGGFPLSSP